MGRQLQLPVESEQREIYGPPIFDTDQPSFCFYTRKTIGWKPTYPSLLENL